jgi:hypothetical protein
MPISLGFPFLKKKKERPSDWVSTDKKLSEKLSSPPKNVHVIFKKTQHQITTKIYFKKT